MKNILPPATACKSVTLECVTKDQSDAVVFFSLSPDKNPTLEIKYRTKKNREKEAESDRGSDRQYSTPSTPDYKSERRRGSKVSGF